MFKITPLFSDVRKKAEKKSWRIETQVAGNVGEINKYQLKKNNRRNQEHREFSYIYLIAYTLCLLSNLFESDKN